MIVVSPAFTKICISGRAKIQTTAEMITQKRIDTRTAVWIPAVTRSGRLAPWFCEINREKALPNSCTGIYASVSILTAAAKAAMIAVPKLFTRPWIIKIPKFITDCCKQVKNAYRPTSENVVFRKIRCSFFGKSCGFFHKATMVMPIPEIPCAITVAPAAPPIPSCNSNTNHRSSTIFKIVETARKIRGRIELPTARRTKAK